MFCSRNPACKSPVGAVEAGTPVHFRITLPRQMRCSGAFLIMEEEGVTTHVSDLFWCGQNEDDTECWECHFTPQGPGLYFYQFEVRTQRGSQVLSRGQAGNAVLGGPDRWQMTVYAAGMETPDWLKGGLMYQIFPDRFARSGKPKQGVPGDRILREDWGGEPAWRPDAQGKVTNSDFFGGDLEGIREKLPYLHSLGVTCIYLNPIFESQSNHRYNTADYSRIDPLLGDEEDFRRLCADAKQLGIHIVLDGVFSHTGSDSVYFNREGRYDSPGAYNTMSSPYFYWYSFRSWPNEYDCWWNFDTLPNVRETEPSYDEFINGEQGIVRHWLRAGASGWRLDVADELPDAFIDSLHRAAKAEKPDAFVLGEVWEDASTKSAYGERRRYLLGGQLDAVMNYPFRDAILGYLMGEDPAVFAETVECLVENYPPQCLHLLMNHIGTHDTERALTMLAGEPAGSRGREWQSTQRLSLEQREQGRRRLKLASLIQYLLPGVPCVYYGDEAGMEGYRDPFNRVCYPWGKEDIDLLEWYRLLGRLRAAQKDILSRGEYRTLLAQGDILAFGRSAQVDGEEQSLVLVINRSAAEQQVSIAVPEFLRAQPLLGVIPASYNSHMGSGVLPPFGYCLVKLHQRSEKSS